jgi:hypothetical protein
MCSGQALRQAQDRQPCPKQSTEKAVFNPLNPPILGNFLGWGDTPRPSAGSFLHLFFHTLQRTPHHGFQHDIRGRDCRTRCARSQRHLSWILISFLGVNILVVRQTVVPLVLKTVPELGRRTSTPLSPNSCVELLKASPNHSKEGIRSKEGKNGKVVCRY